MSIEQARAVRAQHTRIEDAHPTRRAYRTGTAGYSALHKHTRVEDTHPVL